MTAPFASAAARKLAAELAVDEASIAGTGQAGKITIADVRRHAPPPPPEGLGDAGAALWRQLHGGYKFRPDETVLLLSACRTWDELARFEEKLAAASLTVSGSKGQVRPHPLIAEVRAHRLALRQLLAALGINEADEHASPRDGLERSSAGRRLALIRHQGGRG